MGLTIHYSLHADAPDANAARQLVERLRAAAMDLPFTEVGDVVELAGDAPRFEDVEDDDLKWLLVQSTQWIENETGFAQARPSHVIAFAAWPGPGCEVANIGLCRYPATIQFAGKTVSTHIEGWHWESFCKTQYASNPADGGIQNFLRCHLTVIKLLDHARQMNLLAEVKDEGGFWQRRDIASLAETVGQWNQHLAGIVGRCKDWFGDEFLAPIRDYPDFEHLEAKGRVPTAATTTAPRPGDRVRLVTMQDDPDPIDAGQIGTIVAVRRFDDAKGVWHQIDVDWDNGRTLMLVSPPDQFEIVRDGTNRA